MSVVSHYLRERAFQNEDRTSHQLALNSIPQLYTVAVATYTRPLYTVIIAHIQ